MVQGGQGKAKAMYAFRTSLDMSESERLAAGLTHYFTQTFTVTGGFAELAKDSPDEATRHRSLDEVIESSNQGAGIIAKIGAYYGFERLDPQLLNVSDYVRGLELKFREILGSGVGFVGHYGSNAGEINFDPQKLEEILTELVMNVGGSMSDGDRLLVNTHSKTLDKVKSASHDDIPAGEYAVISIRDTGQGIEPDAIPVIFHPFFSTKEIDKGRGLGLSFVYGTVRKSGGYVDVQSWTADISRNTGTKIDIYLPIVSEPMHE